LLVSAVSSIICIVLGVRSAISVGVRDGISDIPDEELLIPFGKEKEQLDKRSKQVIAEKKGADFINKNKNYTQ
jgi:hypothetical protein